jgi:hypothetical protein
MTADESSFKKLAAEPDAPKSLYAKLAEVMSEVGYVEKRGYNSFHGYKYVTEADLVDAVRAKLAARNVVVIPSLSTIDERPFKTSKGKDSVITTARIAYTFCDGDSGETHTAMWAGAGEDPADKGLYKAMTGSEKYFLMKSFMIATGDDPERDEASSESAPKDVQRNGQSDAPAEDVWWTGTIGPLLKQVNPSAEELRNAVEVAQGRPLPEHIASWKVTICKLPPDGRMVFEAWLTQQAAAGTPIA